MGIDVFVVQYVLLLRLLAEVLPVQVEDRGVRQPVNEKPCEAVDDIGDKIVEADPFSRINFLDHDKDRNCTEDDYYVANAEDEECALQEAAFTLELAHLKDFCQRAVQKIVDYHKSSGLESVQY